jgi:hypothetical protein
MNIAVQRAIIQQEMQTYENTIYLLQLRHRVNVKLGSSPDILKSIEEELIKNERGLDILKDELEALEVGIDMDASVKKGKEKP